MPRVPRYEPQVQTQAMSAPRARGVSPDAFGAGLARGLGYAAQDLQQVSDNDDALAAKREIDEYNAWEVKALHDDADGLLPNSRGEAAITPVNGMTLEQRAVKTRQDYVQEAMKRLSNDRQKALFEGYISKQTPSYLLTVNRWEEQERRAARVEQNKASTENLRQSVFSLATKDDFDPDLYAQEIGKVTESVKLRSALEGFGPESEVTKAAISATVSNAHAYRVSSLLNKGDVKAAVAYFEEKGELLNGKDRNALEPVIVKARKLDQAETTAESVWQEMQPKTVNDLLDLAGMRAKLRESNLPDDVRELAEKQVEQNAAEYLQEKRFGEEAASQRVYGLAGEGRGYREVIKAIDLAPELDNRSRENLRDWADRHYKVSEGQAEAKADAKMQSQLGQMAKLFAFQQEYVSGLHGQLTPSQVATKAAEFGAFTDDAMRFVNSVNNAPVDAETTAREINDAMLLLRQNEQYKNLIPDPSTKDDKEKAKMVLLRNKVHEIVAQSAKGQKGPGAKPMTTQAALLKAIQTVTTDEGARFFGFTVPGTRNDDPLYLLGTDLVEEDRRHPSTWPKATQDRVIDETWANDPRNKGRVMTPQQRELLRAKLLQ